MRFKDYIWRTVRGGMVFFWAVLTFISVVSYVCLLVFLKNRQLTSSLNVSAYTVHESVSAGDWTLALGHLKALEKSGPVFDIHLRRKLGGVNLTGPFGEKPFGLGKLCDEVSVRDTLVLSGCVRVLGITEFYTAVLFVLLAAALFLTVFRLVRTKMLFVIERVSSDLRKIRALGETSKRGEADDALADVEELVSLRAYISNLLDETEKVTEELAKNRLSAQVAHDIRSPLAALTLVADDLRELREPQRIMIRSAITRIQDIANNLLQRADPSNETGTSTSTELLSGHIDSIVSEARARYRSKLGLEISSNLSSDSYGIFAVIDPTEFKRVLSNLINNSVEAIRDDGIVEVVLQSKGSLVELRIRDNGSGIPAEILPSVMQEGFTFGKEGGTGLGLHHAKATVERWAGRISIDSRPGIGTTVSLFLPKADPPQWFVPRIEIGEGTAIVVLDDDISVHQIWKNRIAGIAKKESLHFSSAAALRNWFLNVRAIEQDCLYLIDYELLGEPTDGLRTIDSLDILEASILVTSRHDDKSLLDECLRLGVRLIPKALAAFVPVSNPKVPVSPVASILIDDDPMVRRIWQVAAEKKGINLTLFERAEDFFVRHGDFPSNTVVYVDSNLGSDVAGEKTAEQIRELGFEQVFLTTGYNPTGFEEMPWLKAVIGKSPPW